MTHKNNNTPPAKFISFLFILLCISQSGISQHIEVQTKAGSEPAQFSYIFRNGGYAGISDSTGTFFFQAGSLEKGDVIWAEYAGYKSDELTYNGKKGRITLNISNAHLKEITVLSEKANILEDYLNLLKYNKVIYNLQWKYGSNFNAEFNHNGKKTAASGFMEVMFKPIDGILSISKDCFTFLAHNCNSDSTTKEKALRFNAFCIANSILAITWNTNKKYLERRLELKNLLLHRIISEDGTTSYLLLEGDKRDNQTIITLDPQKRYFTKIERHFLGGGYRINAEEDVVHSVSITPKHKGRYMEIEEVYTVFKQKGVEISVKTTNLYCKKPTKKESRVS